MFALWVYLGKYLYVDKIIIELRNFAPSTCCIFLPQIALKGPLFTKKLHCAAEKFFPGWKLHCLENMFALWVYLGKYLYVDKIIIELRNFAPSTCCIFLPQIALKGPLFTKKLHCAAEKFFPSWKLHSLENLFAQWVYLGKYLYVDRIIIEVRNFAPSTCCIFWPQIALKGPLFTEKLHYGAEKFFPSWKLHSLQNIFTL